ncbi:MAG TPA: DEAD/DEAH box helicase family protein, partial [Candidatus Dojkabacteria bacterium]|nr:DEAD/DEAH box helicase family protein [Candidatus Dojkabacteria bacterium]
MFDLVANYKPTGDQPFAIDKLVTGIKKGSRDQVLLGVTGSGKTFTIANVIAQVNKPTLIISHNKTLAAQLYQEFKEFFPNNSVQYFVSYYDYYQPEAYIPQRDLYIEKDSSINEEIDKLRLATTSALLSRKDVIVISSVSCIYNIGSPKEYHNAMHIFKVGEVISLLDIQSFLIDLRYERNELDFSRGTFRVRGNSVDIYPSYEDIG